MNDQSLSDNHEHTYNILVDLDALLDTRLALLTVMDIELAKKVINNYYTSRKTDDFTDSIGQEKAKEFKERYKVRQYQSDLILRYAMPTLIVKYIIEIYDRFAKENHFMSERQKNHVDINIYPYTLTDDQRRALIINLSKNIYSSCQVKIVSLDPTKQPKTIIRNYHEYISYHYGVFLKSFIDCQLAVPSYKLTIPCLALDVEGFNQIETTMSVKDVNLEEVYRDYATLLTPMISLTVAPIISFTPLIKK